MSLFVAVTLVPVLCSRLLVLPPPREQRKGLGGRLYTMSEEALRGLDEGYRRMLHLALNHRPTVIGLAAASVVAAVMILPTLPTEFTTQADEGQVRVNVELAQGTRIEVTEPVMLRVEAMVNELVPEKTDVILNAGGGGFGSNLNRGDLQILLVPKDQRTRSSEQIAMDLRRQLSGIPGVIIRANAAGGNQATRFLAGGGGFGGPGGSGRLQLEVRGEDLDEARRLSQAAKDLLDTVPGVADARLGRDEGRPELAVRVDRAKAALFGVGATTVANTIRTNVAGTQAAMFREKGNEYPIVVRLREEERQAVGDVEDILVSTPQGQVIPAKNLMRVENSIGPTAIDRKNQQRITYVNAEPETTLSEAVSEVEARLAPVRETMSRDFSMGFGAEVEQQAQAFDQLRMVLILALVLVYAVMASQYESLRDPFIIMFSVPTAAIGVVLALKLTNTSFNMQAYIGIIMLAGIVVSNGILLVDYTNVLRRRDGLPLREAVELAGRTRLRPILMTSIATALGLVPMSLGLGEGSELQVPLARVVIGGLTTSLLITLVLVPTVYTIFEEGIKWPFGRRMSSEKHA
jgi:HAE1 family hydrophobic/amphiphilic exporter-1